MSCSHLLSTSALLMTLGASVNALAMGTTLYLRVDSTLHADGSIERAIVQPVTLTPAAARAPDAWGQTTFALREDVESLPSIPELPITQDEQEYIAAWGRFTSVDDIPDHYEKYPLEWADEQFRRPIPGKLEPSRLERRYVRTDHVFAVEHEWEERVTNPVRTDDAMKALDELIEHNVELYREALAAGVRPEYDPSPYLEWYGRDLLKALRETFTAWVVAVHERQDEAFEGEPLEFEHIAELSVPVSGVEEDDKLWFRFSWGAPDVPAVRELDDDSGTFSLFPWLLERAPERAVRRRDGKALGAREVESIWSDDAEAAIKTVIDRRGGVEALWEKSLVASARMSGPFWCDFFCDLEHFRFSLKMPGHIVETSGVWEADDEVVWVFSGEALIHIFPLGYRMYARSLEPELELQQALIGRPLLTTRKELLDFVDIVTNDSDLGVWLAQSRDAGKLLPEGAYRLGWRYGEQGFSDMWLWHCESAGRGYAPASIDLASWYRADEQGPFYWSEIRHSGKEEDKPRVPRHLLAKLGGRDDRAAFVWYALAARNGAADAAELKREVARRLSPGQLSEAERMVEQWTPDKCPWPG